MKHQWSTVETFITEILLISGAGELAQHLRKHVFAEDSDSISSTHIVSNSPSSRLSIHLYSVERKFAAQM